MALLTRAQLIQRLGGDPSAAQLLDPNQTGTVDNDMLDSAISDAEGDVAAALGSRYLAVSSNPSAKIVRIMGQLATYYAWGADLATSRCPRRCASFTAPLRRT